jgi:predicted nuclease with TOPRIM domain
MTPEQRLDRLERIAKLFVRAGLRERSRMREMDDKIAILIDMQIKNEERFAENEKRFAEYEKRFARNEKRAAQNEERFAKYEERFAQNEERFAKQGERSAKYEELFAENEKKFAQLAESQSRTDRKLDVLIDIIREGRNGKPTADS